MFSLPYFLAGAPFDHGTHNPLNCTGYGGPVAPNCSRSADRLSEGNTAIQSRELSIVSATSAKNG